MRILAASYNLCLQRWGQIGLWNMRLSVYFADRSSPPELESLIRTRFSRALSRYAFRIEHGTMWIRTEQHAGGSCTRCTLDLDSEYYGAVHVEEFDPNERVAVTRAILAATAMLRRRF